MKESLAVEVTARSNEVGRAIVAHEPRGEDGSDPV